MSASSWLVPLNVHHSLKLRSLTSSSNTSSAHLQNISSSLTSLTNSINRIERNSIELTGTANAILELLQSNQYKEITIGAMRSLLFNHAKTCKEAMNEDDSVLAYSICVTSERIMNQPWFNFDLFSLVSFDEMEKASEIRETCQTIMKQIEDKMDSEERNMINVFVESMDKIEVERESLERKVDDFVRIFREHKNDFLVGEKKIYYQYFEVGKTGGWLTEGTPSRYKKVTLLRANRNILGIPIRETLPFLEPRKTRVDWLPGYQLIDSYKKWKKSFDDYIRFEKSIITPANVLFNGRIRIEGQFSDTSQEELDDLSVLDDGYYQIDIIKIHSEIDNENDDKFNGVDKNLGIDESIIEHYTQILFLVHEMGNPIDLEEFRFTRDELIEYYKKDILANKDELIFDEDFIIDFPEYIDDFIREFCIRQ